MTPEILTVFGVLLCSLILFAQERLPVDLIAVSVAVFLMLTGIVTPTEGLSGFSHPATVTVTAMFILSAGPKPRQSKSSVCSSPVWPGKVT